MTQEGFTVWFVGLTGSGKSTLAERLRDDLARRGRAAELLDAGKIRQQLNRDLGFTRDDVEKNLKRIGYECKLLNRNGVVAIVAAISPYRDVRDAVRADVGRWVEIYCRCSMDTLLNRDTKGLLQQAQDGKLDNVAGINAPFDEPIKPEVLLNTDTESPDDCSAKILTTLEMLGYLEQVKPATYSKREEELIRQRLQDLGYL
jgi:adenylyl-sulfate kinase